MITEIQKSTFKKAREILRAIDHKLRQQLMEFIETSPRSVTQIYVHFRWEQSVASQHLAILRKAGWVRTERNGKEVIYSVNQEHIDKYYAAALSMMAQSVADHRNVATESHQLS